MTVEDTQPQAEVVPRASENATPDPTKQQQAVDEVVDPETQSTLKQSINDLLAKLQVTDDPQEAQKLSAELSQKTAQLP